MTALTYPSPPGGEPDSTGIGGGSFNGVHNDLNGRSTAGAHPDTAVAVATPTSIGLESGSTTARLALAELVTRIATSSYRHLEVPSDDTVTELAWNDDGTLTWNDLELMPGSGRAIIKLPEHRGTRQRIWCNTHSGPFKSLTEGVHINAASVYEEAMSDATPAEITGFIGAMFAQSFPLDMSGDPQTITITVSGVDHVSGLVDGTYADGTALLGAIFGGMTPSFAYGVDWTVGGDGGTLVTIATGAAATIAISTDSGPDTLGIGDLVTVQGADAVLTKYGVDNTQDSVGDHPPDNTGTHTSPDQLNIHYKAWVVIDGAEGWQCQRWPERKEYLPGGYATPGVLTQQADLRGDIDEIVRWINDADPLIGGTDRSILVATVDGDVGTNVDIIDADTTLGPVTLTLGTTTAAWPIPVIMRAGSDDLVIQRADTTTLITIPGGTVGIRAWLVPGETDWRAVSLDDLDGGSGAPVGTAQILDATATAATAGTLTVAADAAMVEFDPITSAFDIDIVLPTGRYVGATLTVVCLDDHGGFITYYSGATTASDTWVPNTRYASQTLAWDGASWQLVASTIGNTVAQQVVLATTSGAVNSVLEHDGKTLLFTSGSAQSFTVERTSDVPHPLGTTIKVVQRGAGALTVIAGTGVTIHGMTTGVLTAQWSTALLTHVDFDVWVAEGAIG